jgi:hypothetical protein
LGAVLQGADGGGAYGYDAAAFAAGAVEGGGGFCGEGVALAVEADFDAFDAEWGEGAEADVEGELGDFYAAGGDGSEDLGVKWRPAVGAATEPRCSAKTVW